MLAGFRRRAGQGLVAFARSITNVVTGAGWAALVAMVVCLVVGYAAGWLEFAVVGVALALLVAVCLVFLVGQARYDVELWVDSNRTVVGTPVVAGVGVADGGRRPLLASHLEVMLGAEAIELRLPSRRTRGGTRDSEFRVPAVRRGVVTVGPVRTVQGDPIGLFRRHLDWTRTVDVYVHPDTVSVPSTSTGLIRDLEGNPTRDLTASDISFHALREYRPGDERRHIHWKSTARTGQLTVRQFEETRRSHIVVAFSLSTADYANEDEFELAVSAAASIAGRAIHDSRQLTVVTSPDGAGDAAPRAPRVLRSTSRARLLDDFSELVYAETAVGLGGLSRLAASTVSGISLVFLLCGSTPSVRELRSWSLLFPAGVQIVAVVCKPEQLPTQRRVAELTVLTIGYLDDLRIAMSKAVSA